MPLSERLDTIPDALSVRCRGCQEPVGKPCRTPSGYVLEGTHDVRWVDVALARARDAEAARDDWRARAFIAVTRAEGAEAAHFQMVRKAGELRDERDRLREALDAIGSLGGPLHMLEPDQGNGPPNYEWAATELRRILNTVNEGDAA